MPYTAPGRCPRCNGTFAGEYDPDLRRHVQKCIACGRIVTEGETMPRGQYERKPQVEPTIASPEPTSVKRVPQDQALAEFAAATQHYIEVSTGLRTLEATVEEMRAAVAEAQKDVAAAGAKLGARLADVGFKPTQAASYKLPHVMTPARRAVIDRMREMHRRDAEMKRIEATESETVQTGEPALVTA